MALLGKFSQKPTLMELDVFPFKNEGRVDGLMEIWGFPRTAQFSAVEEDSMAIRMRDYSHAVEVMCGKVEAIPIWVSSGVMTSASTAGFWTTST